MGVQNLKLELQLSSLLHTLEFRSLALTSNYVYFFVYRNHHCIGILGILMSKELVYEENESFA
jgi:hypothetical protein